MTCTTGTVHNIPLILFVIQYFVVHVQYCDYGDEREDYIYMFLDRDVYTELNAGGNL